MRPEGGNIYNSFFFFVGLLLEHRNEARRWKHLYIFYTFEPDRDSASDLLQIVYKLELSTAVAFSHWKTSI